MHKWLQMLYGCQQKMTLAKSRGLKSEGGDSPSDWRESWTPCLRKRRKEQGPRSVMCRVQTSIRCKLRPVLPECYSSQGASSKKRVFGAQVWPGHLFDVLWKVRGLRCSLRENQGTVTTARGKRLCTVPTLTPISSPNRLEAQAFIQKFSLGDGHMKSVQRAEWDKTEHQPFLKGLVF